MFQLGGGKSSEPPLTATEEAMAALIDDIAVEGIPGLLDREDFAAEEEGTSTI